ncbi:hypothetical protein GCM10009541_25410 [Micromonospora gifhornensis]|uniref:EspG family protein n=1 Tax=Micromonospora gifhornensis TaxID=84594 RepID=A0ABQ4IHY6_9ACTN|nr:hypothetical protein Vgi01_41190 [Micromonospora gifhornensis]
MIREMNGKVSVFQRDDGRIYVASYSRVAQGPTVLNGWCDAVSADVADNHLGVLVQEGLRIGQEPERDISPENGEEHLRGLLKLAKVRSFAAFARGSRAVGVRRDDSGAYFVFYTENSGVRTGFSYTGNKTVVPSESSADEIGRAVRAGLASSST